MSRGPTREVGQIEGADYAHAFRTTNRLISLGKSWSGNERNRCFLNTGSIRFANVSATTGLDLLDDARAMAVVDWDGDGDLDLFQINRSAPQVRFLRNDWESEHHWLAVRLQGTNCNRDAIGARVRLHRNGSTEVDMRTLYAGSGFLSQSSKWLHFGLGPNDDLEKLEVRWPDGQSESFVGLRANAQYHLIQGTGQGSRVAPRRQAVKLAESAPHVRPAVQHARVVLGARAPLPRLSYRRFDGHDQALNMSMPTLLQLWASWCPMCQAEMHEFTRRADEVRAAGISVVALSVDGVGQDQSTVENARSAVKRFQFPFAVGSGTEELLDKLEVLRGELFSNLRPYPIPSSFLIDASGRLVVMYLGPVEVDQLIADARHLGTSDEALRRLSSPVHGRWFTPPKAIQLSSLASAFEDAGYVDDAGRYRQLAVPQIALGHCSIALDLERQGDMAKALSYYGKALELDPNSATIHNFLGKHLMRRRDVIGAERSFTRAIEIDWHMAEAHYNLATVQVLQRRVNEAKSSYDRAIQVDAQYAEAHAALGRLLQREQRLSDAEKHLSAAIQSDPTLAPAHVYLGMLYAGQKRLSKAAELLRTAAKLQPDLADAHAGLGGVVALQGNSAEAIAHYREALRINPNAHAAALQLAWHLSTDSIDSQSGVDAVSLAQRVASATRFRSPRALDVLAAAYARAGRFDDAIAMARQALGLPNVSRQLAGDIQARLSLYEQGRPYHPSADNRE